MMIEDKPFLGVGFNNYLSVASHYGISDPYVQFGRPVHNQYLLAAAELGLIGFTLFLLNLFYWGWLTIRASKVCRNQNLCWFSYGVQGSLVALCLTSLLDAPLIKPPVLSILAILIAGISALSIHYDKSNHSPIVS